MAAQTRAIFSQLQHRVSKTSSGSDVHSYYSDLGSGSPVLTLIHGYPQSAFIWRHIVPALVDRISLFVPELPGYGISSPCNEQSKKAIGAALLEALADCYGGSHGKRQQVILGGHDRGARICHRLALDKNEFPNLEVLGTVLIDIVPTKVQWDNFSNPAMATGYFHWPLLANAELATEMLMAYGGGRWAREGCLRLMGPNEAGRKRLQSDDALQVYDELFDKRDTIWYSCLDYKEGSVNESAAQAEDQKNGRKIDVPTLVMFSKAKLGSRLDVASIWKDWVKPGVSYKSLEIGNGYGHHLPEEAPDEVSEAIVSFIESDGFRSWLSGLSATAFFSSGKPNV